MAIITTPADLMRGALSELELASHNHEEWAERLHGVLIARQTPEATDLDDDAHHKCRFGQWYDSTERSALRHHPGFAGVGIEHEHMHQLATRLLRQTSAGTAIAPDDYKEFIAVRKRLMLEIETLRREFAQKLNSLDGLTGLPSRIEMLSELRAQHELAVRHVQTSCLVMMDLDQFKQINDKYGHPTGDKVLFNVAQHISASLRAYDKVFRYGGEEFLICLVAVDPPLAASVIERLRVSLAALPHAGPGSEWFHVTASFGLALLDPAVPVEQSINRADKAMYAAKEQGRNRLVAWDKAAMPPSRA